jgi:hypothetical protein
MPARPRDEVDLKPLNHGFPAEASFDRPRRISLPDHSVGALAVIDYLIVSYGD